MAVRQEVNNFESSVVVQELEFAMNLALYGPKITSFDCCKQKLKFTDTNVHMLLHGGKASN